MKRHQTAACAPFICLLIFLALTLTRQAAAQTPPNPCQPGQDLITVPEIRSENGRLRAEITVTSGRRTLWGSAGDTRCVSQDLRYIRGRNLLKPGLADPAFSGSDPIPGPTLRARVGDLIEIKFLNQVDTQAFANSLDQANTSPANTTGCDEVRSDQGLIYPNPSSGGTPGDVMPNCLHGSSTSNMHFHGTHTTPDTTGDNVLLFVRPALRGAGGEIRPNGKFVDEMFAQIFSECEKNGTPTQWEQLPAAWRTDQEELLKEYDRTAPYRGRPGTLPPEMQLWPANHHQIEQGVWPQYQIGAYPFCFRLADPKSNLMGQSPGTHWYHAHKHGSTALNVANGMAGVFVIEGQYDDDLRRFYGRDFRDQVLMIQQLSSTPFPLLDPRMAQAGPNTVPKPQLSVNGRLNPVLRMRPGEVQLWRLVNGAFRDAVYLQGFAPQRGLAWRQIAQDGVQFHYANYRTVGAVNRAVYLAPANRADLLVKAPLQPGRYQLTALSSEGLALVLDWGALCLPSKPNPCIGNFKPGSPTTLLTVSVEGAAVSPAQDFIQNERDFPAFPTYLTDIPVQNLSKSRTVDFGAVHNLIDGKTFDPNVYNQTMTLNSAEEWKISNEANDKSHPFHIHVNPFQVIEVFAPNAENTTDPNKPCYVDPNKPETWKPCKPLPAPYVWWDTFAIPTSKTYDVTKQCNSDVNQCPVSIRAYAKCKGTDGTTTCTQTIPGYFKMRSRFVDFTGTYVVHCHILIHEDRGMMQLVRVIRPGETPLEKPPYAHH